MRPLSPRTAASSSGCSSAPSAVPRSGRAPSPACRRVLDARSRRRHPRPPRSTRPRHRRPARRGLPGRLVADGDRRRRVPPPRGAAAHRRRQRRQPGTGHARLRRERRVRRPDAARRGLHRGHAGVHRAVVLGAGRAAHRRRRTDGGDGARVLPATPPGGLTAPLAVLAQDETSGCEAADFAGVPAGRRRADPAGDVPVRGEVDQRRGGAGGRGARGEQPGRAARPGHARRRRRRRCRRRG